MIAPDRLKAFLDELTALSIKHRISIGGCGCCGSPSLDEMTDHDIRVTPEYQSHYKIDNEASNLKWNR